MPLSLRPLGSTGLMVSPIGFGGGTFGGFYGAFDESEGIRAVHHAIDRGINLFDTSPYYGEAEVRRSLKGSGGRLAPENYPCHQGRPHFQGCF